MKLSAAMIPEPCPCLDCDAPMVEEERLDTFLYGEIPISVTIPIMFCPACGFAMTGEGAEEIREMAIFKAVQGVASRDLSVRARAR